MTTSKRRHGKRRKTPPLTPPPPPPVGSQQALLTSYVQVLSAVTACSECGRQARRAQTPGNDAVTLRRPCHFIPSDNSPSRLGHWIRKGVELGRLQQYLATCVPICSACLRKGNRP